jgi:dipeptidyl aminopeptidase/acylaminoacyl peptidase
MKNFYVQPSGVKYAVLLLSLLTGCIQVTPFAATQTSTTVATQTNTTVIASTKQPTKTALSWTPFAPSNIKLADLPSNCSGYETWSPDLKWAVDQCGPNSAVVVWKIGELQPTTTLVANDISGNDARFSPDGEKLLVAINHGPLLLFEVGHWQTPQTLYPQLPTYAIPTWAPDSQSFAISYLVEGQALSIMKLDGTYKNLLGLNEVNTQYGDDGTNMFGPTWSPDSSKIAYVVAKNVSNQPPVQLWTIEVESGKKELLYAGKSGEIAYRPEWSPDGSKILLMNETSAQWSGDNKLYIYDIKQKTFSALLGSGNPGNPIWSPDSQHLVFCDTLGRLYVISLNSPEFSIVSRSCGTGYQWKDNHSLAVAYLDVLYLIPLP